MSSVQYFDRSTRSVTDQAPHLAMKYSNSASNNNNNNNNGSSTSSVIGRCLHAWCAVGYHTSDSGAAREQKYTTSIFTLCAILFCVISASVWPQGPVQRSYHCVAAFIFLAAHFSYALHKQCIYTRRVLGLTSVMYPVLLAVDYRNDCGATYHARGCWYVAQCVISQLWYRMGGSHHFGLGVTLLNSLTSLVVVIVEGIVYGGGCGNNDDSFAVVYGRTVVQTLLPLFCLSMVNHAVAFDADHPIQHQLLIIDPHNQSRSFVLPPSSSQFIVSFSEDVVRRGSATEEANVNRNESGGFTSLLPLASLAHEESTTSPEPRRTDSPAFGTSTSSLQLPAHSRPSSDGVLRTSAQRNPPEESVGAKSQHQRLSAFLGDDMKTSEKDLKAVKLRRQASNLSVGSAGSPRQALKTSPTTSVYFVLTRLMNHHLLLQADNAGPALQRFANVSERMAVDNKGKLLWMCDYESVTKYDTAQDAVGAAQKMELRLRDIHAGVQPIAAICFGDLVGGSIRTKARKSIVFVGVSTILDKCRDLCDVAPSLPCQVICDNETAMMYSSDNLIGVDSLSPRLGLVGFIVPALDAALYEFDNDSSSVSASTTLTSRQSSVASLFQCETLSPNRNSARKINNNRASLAPLQFARQKSDAMSDASSDNEIVSPYTPGGSAKKRESVFVSFFNTVLKSTLGASQNNAVSKTAGASSNNAMNVSTMSPRIRTTSPSKTKDRKDKKPTFASPTSPSNSFLVFQPQRSAAGMDSSAGNMSDNALDASIAFECIQRPDMSRGELAISRVLGASKERRVTRAVSTVVPPGVPLTIWNYWKQCNVDMNNCIPPEELWRLLRFLNLDISPERFYGVLQAIDADGKSAITVDEFMDAYRGPTLGGLLLLSEVKVAVKAAADIQGMEHLDFAIDLWRANDRSSSGAMSLEDAAEFLKNLGVECTSEAVMNFVMELEGEQDVIEHVLRMEDFVSIFAPELSKEDEEFCFRREAVSRVMSTANSQRVYLTMMQEAEEEAKAFSNTFKALTAPLLLLYIYFVSLETPLAASLCAHENFTETFVPRKLAEISVDVLVMAWVVSKFFLPREVNGRMLVDKLEIRTNYLHSVEFIVDLIAVLPTDVAALALPHGCHVETFRLNKALLLYHFNSQYATLVANTGVLPSVSRITQTVLWWVLSINAFASIFIYCLRFEDDEVITNLLAIDNFLEQELSLIYLQAFDWALFMMVGLARGEDPIPETDSLILLSLFTVFAGVISYSIILSAILNALNIRDSKALFLERMEEVASFVSYSKMPPDGASELSGFYKHMFYSSGATQLSYNPLDDLPLELSIRIQVQQAHDLLGGTNVFLGLDEYPDFMHEVVRCVTPRVLMPDECLVSAGEAESFMCCVAHGQLWRDFGPDRVEVLLPGHYFGSLALVHALKASATVRCHPERYTNVFILEHIDYSGVAKRFPECAELVADNVHDVLRRVVSAMIASTSKRSKSRTVEGGGEDYSSTSGVSVNVDLEAEIDEYLLVNYISNTNVATMHRAVVEKIRKQQTT